MVTFENLAHIFENADPMITGQLDQDGLYSLDIADPPTDIEHPKMNAVLEARGSKDHPVPTPEDKNPKEEVSEPGGPSVSPPPLSTVLDKALPSAPAGAPPGSKFISEVDALKIIDFLKVVLDRFVTADEMYQQRAHLTKSNVRWHYRMGHASQQCL
jgi:hypothetical protein